MVLCRALSVPRALRRKERRPKRKKDRRRTLLQLRSSTSASCPLNSLNGLLPNTGMTLTGVLAAAAAAAAAADGEGPAEPFFFGVEEGAGGGGAARERGGESGLEETGGESLGWEEAGGEEAEEEEGCIAVWRSEGVERTSQTVRFESFTIIKPSVQPLERKRRQRREKRQQNAPRTTPSFPPTAKYLPSSLNLIAHTAFFFFFVGAAVPPPPAPASSSVGACECCEALSATGGEVECIEAVSSPPPAPGLGGEAAERMLEVGGEEEEVEDEDEEGMNSSWARKSLPKSFWDLPLALTCTEVRTSPSVPDFLECWEEQEREERRQIESAPSRT